MAAALLIVLAGGSYWLAAGVWLSLPDKVRHYAPAYRDWEIATALTITGVLVVPITAMVIAIVRPVVQSRWPHASPSPNSDKAERSDADALTLEPIPRRGRVAFVLIAALGLVSIALGIATILFYGAFWLGLSNILVGGAITAGAGVSLRRNSRARSPLKSLTVDRAGLHLSIPVPFFLPWRAIGVIVVGHDGRTGCGSESHVIDVFPRQMPPAPEVLLRFGRGSKARHFGIHTPNRAVLSINPLQEYNRSPTAVLEVLDRFRPADVPIHDLRRIEDEVQT